MSRHPLPEFQKKRRWAPSVPSSRAPPVLHKRDLSTLILGPRLALRPPNEQRWRQPSLARGPPRSPGLAFPRFPERGRRSTHHGGYGSAGAGNRSRHRVPVTVLDKLRVEVSNALRWGRCGSHLSNGPGRGWRAQAVPWPQAPPPVRRTHSAPG